jgi:hypothetical protein
MKYVISEATTGEIIKIYHDIDDVVGNDYFYFKHLTETKKKSYKDGERVLTITEDEDLTVL